MSMCAKEESRDLTNHFDKVPKSRAAESWIISEQIQNVTTLQNLIIGEIFLYDFLLNIGQTLMILIFCLSNW